MRKFSVFYFFATVAFAVFASVCSKEWAFNSDVKENVNDFFKNLIPGKVSILHDRFAKLIITPRSSMQLSHHLSEM